MIRMGNRSLSRPSQTRFNPLARTTALSSRPATSSGAPPRSPLRITPTREAHNLTNVRFSDFQKQGLISQKAVEILPFEFCTQVQAETLLPILQGRDVLARAKTGTGKTIAFMLPAIERLLKQKESPDPYHTSILVLSPTRELALQISQETKTLVQGRSSLEVHCVVGGTNMNTEARRLNNSRIDIIIATPGRLIDHIENSGLRPKLQYLQCLILDEADRLLDQGFKRDIQKILDALANRNSSPRQTLLFSATLPQEVQTLSSMTLLPGFAYISTVSENEQSTHEHVKQQLAFVNPSQILSATASIINDTMERNTTAKCIVFLPTARETSIFAQTVGRVLSESHNTLPVFEVHSRKSQPARSKATEGFRAVIRGILFSSDVTARGIDIPGVTDVFQIGLPSDAEQYVHRLGRTARAGKEGRGVLILSHDHSFFLKKKGMNTLSLNSFNEDEMRLISQQALEQWSKKISTALQAVDHSTKTQAYQAWLGFNKTFQKDLKWSDAELVKRANNYARDVLQYRDPQTGQEVPPIFSNVVGKMNLKSVRHLLRVVSKAELPLSRDG